MMERSKIPRRPLGNQAAQPRQQTRRQRAQPGRLDPARNGDWWFITHQGTGDWEGRAMVLLPVTWIDGWPIIGKPGPDGIGNMVWTAKKPIAGPPAAVPKATTNSTAAALGPQWEWNYQPRKENGRSPSARLPPPPRLQTPPANNLLKAGNTLTQRAMPHRQQRSHDQARHLRHGRWPAGRPVPLRRSLFLPSASPKPRHQSHRFFTTTPAKSPPAPTHLRHQPSGSAAPGATTASANIRYSTDGKTFTNFGRPLPSHLGQLPRRPHRHLHLQQ